MTAKSPATLPRELEPFAENLASARTRELAIRTFEWATEHGVLAHAPPKRAGMLVVVTSVFSELCSPTTPLPMTVDWTARFTLIFFCIDDATTASLDAFLPDVDAAWSIGPLTGALETWRSDVRLASARPALVRSFAQAYRDYLVARRSESGGAIGVEGHWAARRKTIFMDPYVAQWIVTLGIGVDSFAPRGFEDAYALGKDIVLLSNDLGSIDRDRPGGDAPDDLNLVNAYREAEGWSLERALDELVERHNRMVADYRSSVEAARVAAASVDADRYADLLTGVVDGNLGSLHSLKFRYQRVEHVLARLDWVVAPRLSGPA